MTLLGILATIILLGILIFVHEFGHFIIARACKVKVEKFSFGFGPKLFGKTIGETEYRVSLIPLGGYVKMLGENPDEQSSDSDTSNRSFQHKRWWQKVFIATGGPLANFIFAILIFILTLLVGIKTYDFPPVVGKIESEELKRLTQLQPMDKIIAVDGREIDGWISILQNWSDDPNSTHEVTVQREDEIITIEVPGFDPQNWFTVIRPFAPPILGDVMFGMPAYEAGLQNNDKVRVINDRPINDWYEMQSIIQKNAGNRLLFTIERGDEILTIPVTPQPSPELGQEVGIIGVSQLMTVTSVERYNLPDAIRYGFTTTIAAIGNYYEGLCYLVSNPSQLSQSVGGPITIAAISGQQVQEGLGSFLSFIGMISIILMVMNLLPIPVLDGGQIIFALWEGVVRKPLTPLTQERLQRIGFAIILFLVFLAFYNDISRFVTRYFSSQNLLQ
jgi:regulator of sigma E protease